jgi:hypothetical protein
MTQVIDGLWRSTALPRPCERREQTLRISWRAEKMHCFKQALQFVGGYQSDIFTVATLNDNNITIVDHVIKQRRQSCARLCAGRLDRHISLLNSVLYRSTVQHALLIVNTNA